MYIQITLFILASFVVSPLYENQNMDLDLLFKKSSDAESNSKFNDAIFYLDEILEYDPNNVSALNNKGVMLLHLEKYEESLPYFEKALELNPDFVEALNNKSAALYNLNRNIDALTVLYDAYKIDPYKKILAEHMAAIIDKSPFVSIPSYAKIEVRNSDDQLIGYTESHKIKFQHPLAMLFLEDKAKRTPVEIDGVKFELLEYAVTYQVLKSGLSSYTTMSLIEEDATGVTVIELSHNGIATKPGDTIYTKIILLRNN